MIILKHAPAGWIGSFYTSNPTSRSVHTGSEYHSYLRCTGKWSEDREKAIELAKKEARKEITKINNRILKLENEIKELEFQKSELSNENQEIYDSHEDFQKQTGRLAL